MLHSYKNKKGFTLVEVLLVVFIIGILSTVALSSYNNSTQNFSFISAYKEMMSSLRNARSYAITNKEGAVGVPDRYGVCISKNSIVLFEDNGKSKFQYDPAPGESFGDCKSPNTGAIQQGFIYDEIVKSYTYTVFNIAALDSKKQSMPLPIVIFYERGSANVSVVKKDQTLMDINDKYLALEFNYPDKNIKKYSVMFLISGLAEEYDDLKQL